MKKFLLAAASLVIPPLTTLASSFSVGATVVRQPANPPANMQVETNKARLMRQTQKTARMKMQQRLTASQPIPKKN